MTRLLAQLSLFVVAGLIGVLLVGQLRSQGRAIELSSLAPEELSTLIETLQQRNVELGAALTDLREQIRTFEGESSVGQSDLSREELLRTRAFAGLEPITGQGIVVEVEGDFEPSNVNDLVYELRNAGAEAIAVDDIRVTARSVAVLGQGAIEIDGQEIDRFFEIKAIGPPQGLRTAMERPGGLLSQLSQGIGAVFRVRTETTIVVPATERDLTPQVALPVE